MRGLYTKYGDDWERVYEDVELLRQLHERVGALMRGERERGNEPELRLRCGGAGGEQHADHRWHPLLTGIHLRSGGRIGVDDVAYATDGDAVLRPGRAGEIVDGNQERGVDADVFLAGKLR